MEFSHEALTGGRSNYKHLGLVYTEDQLSKAFDQIAPKDDWRGQIDKEVAATPMHAQLIRAAISFYTAASVTVESLGDFRYRFRSPGYRMGPAGP